MKNNIEKIEEKIDYIFNNKDLLLQSLTHKSYTNEHKDSPHNERLEFLGDAILQYVATKNLFNMFEKEDEGTLSIYRSLIVKTDFLIKTGEKLGLQNNIRLSTGQSKMKNEGTSIIADAVEALIGAIYIDGGLKKTEKFITKKILIDIKKYLSNIPLLDPKTALQEFSQKEFNATPEYLVKDDIGPDHNKIFSVKLLIDGNNITIGRGKSKQEAAKSAAQKAIETYKNKGYKVY